MNIYDEKRTASAVLASLIVEAARICRKAGIPWDEFHDGLTIQQCRAMDPNHLGQLSLICEVLDCWSRSTCDKQDSVIEKAFEMAEKQFDRDDWLVAMRGEAWFKRYQDELMECAR